MSELVSMVVAVYNGEKYLEEQIESLRNQDYKNLEIIIVDDCSKDSSVKISHAFAAKDPRIQVHQNPANLGFAKNFLNGMLMTKGEFVCFCDQDDVWRADKVRILKELLGANPKNILAYSDLEICDEALQSTHASFWKAAGIAPRKGCLKEKALLRNLAPGCSMMFRGRVRDILKAAPKDLPFNHDHLVFVISAALGNLVYTKERLVKYRQHDKNNIGAFYPSRVNRDFFIQDVQRKIGAVQKIFNGSTDLKFKKVQEFCGFWRNDENLRSRPTFMDYYLFLRNDRWSDKLLGATECLMPEAYRWLKKHKRT